MLSIALDRFRGLNSAMTQQGEGFRFQVGRSKVSLQGHLGILYGLWRIAALVTHCEFFRGPNPKQ